MDEFLENYKLPKLKHDEMINLNSSKTIKVIEFIIKSPEKRNIQAHVSLKKSTKHWKKN